MMCLKISVGALYDLFNTCTFAKTVLSDVDRLFHFYLTTPNIFQLSVT